MDCLSRRWLFALTACVMVGCGSTSTCDEICEHVKSCNSARFDTCAHDRCARAVATYSTAFMDTVAHCATLGCVSDRDCQQGAKVDAAPPANVQSILDAMSARCAACSTAQCTKIAPYYFNGFSDAAASAVASCITAASCDELSAAASKCVQDATDVDLLL
jgi:hypothetical protein